MDNEKENSKSINDDIVNKSTDTPLNVYSENDSVEVNDLISLAETDIPMDILSQLEQKAEAEQSKLDAQSEVPINSIQPEELEMHTGLELADGSVSISPEIVEHPGAENEILQTESYKHSMDMLEEAKMNATYKKYVIYIDKENEEFIDNLTLKERKALINDVLKTQNRISKEQLAEKKRIEKITRILIGIAVFLFTVPALYFAFNVCLEATIQNYKHSKSNFEVLYKETGKIKLNQR